MVDTFALKYRPKTFKDFVGQQVTIAILAKMVNLNKVPTALMFDGPQGIGKTSAGRVLGAALNCEEPNTPCGVCASCEAVFSGNSLVVREIDGSTNGLIADIRALKEELLYSPSGLHRVVLVDEAHGMSRAASDAFLKTLEEPPEGTTFVILSTEPHKILDTIQSRCMRFSFKRVHPKDIKKSLVSICASEDLHIKNELVDYISNNCNGIVRDAYNMLNQVALSDITSVSEFEEFSGRRDYGVALVEAICFKSHQECLNLCEEFYSQLSNSDRIYSLLTETFRDLLVLRNQGSLGFTGEPLVRRYELAKKLTSLKIVNALKILWDFKIKFQAKNELINTELLIVMLSELFKDTKEADSTIDSMLSIEQLMSLIS